MNERANLVAMADGAAQALLKALDTTSADDQIAKQNAANTLRNVLAELGERIRQLEERMATRKG
jgi:hypothetical protein